MAKRQSYTDPITGQVYPDAYWRPTQINIGFGDKRAHVRFQAYADQTARQLGRSPIPGAVHEYDVRSSSDFDGRFGDNANINIRTLAYRIAMETKDTVDGAEPVSFFAHATDLL